MLGLANVGSNRTRVSPRGPRGPRGLGLAFVTFVTFMISLRRIQMFLLTYLLTYVGPVVLGLANVGPNRARVSPRGPRGLGLAHVGPNRARVI